MFLCMLALSLRVCTTVSVGFLTNSSLQTLVVDVSVYCTQYVSQSFHKLKNQFVCQKDLLLIQKQLTFLLTKTLIILAKLIRLLR